MQLLDYQNPKVFVHTGLLTVTHKYPWVESILPDRMSRSIQQDARAVAIRHPLRT